MSERLMTSERLSELQGLELKARLLVEGAVTGTHRSPYRGFSSEFAEHREYSPGDDVRYVDWKVYGKSDRMYVKQFDEETNFACTVLVDTSESMGYRSQRAPVTKLEYATWLAAACAYLVIRQRDAIGLMTFREHIDQYLRPSSTATQFREVCRRLEAAEPNGKSQLGAVLHDTAVRIPRRGVIILISDLFDDCDSLARGWKHLRYGRHDVILMQVLDPAELEFPFDEPLLFKGLEGWGDRLADPRALRKAYLHEVEQHQGRIRGLSRDLKSDLACFRTDQPPGPVLSTLLHRRINRHGT
jgi:uncharacterized protein (DUF58 family)